MTEFKTTLALEGGDVSPDQAFMVAGDLRKALVAIEGIEETEGEASPEGTRSATLLGLATVLVTSGTVALLIKAVQDVLETRRIESAGVVIRMYNINTGEHKSVTISKDMDTEAVSKIVAELS